MLEIFLIPLNDPWVPPIQPMIIERYFEPPLTQYGAGNRGVDIQTQPHTPVRAPQDGIVHFAGTINGIGILSINHNQLKTTFQPIEAIVESGEYIKRNQIIGYVSTSGSHCEPKMCLHWGLIQEKRYLNPLGVLASKKIRLLPVLN